MRFVCWVVVGAVIIVLIISGVTIWAWLGPDPNRVGATATVAVAGGTLALALATLVLAGVAFNQMKEERKRAQETQRASLRPLLIPVNPLGLVPNPDNDAVAEFWSGSGRLSGHEVEIENVGSGVATNVCGVILPPIEPTPDTDKVFSMRLPRPIANGQPLHGHFEIGAILIFPGNHIENISLFAPKNPFYLLRLTLTYWDVLGLKHASVFDLNRNLVWEQVAILNEISQDLRDIDAGNQPGKRKSMAPTQSS